MSALGTAVSALAAVGGAGAGVGVVWGAAKGVARTVETVLTGYLERFLGHSEVLKDLEKRIEDLEGR